MHSAVSAAGPGLGSPGTALAPGTHPGWCGAGTCPPSAAPALSAAPLARCHWQNRTVLWAGALSSVRCPSVLPPALTSSNLVPRPNGREAEGGRVGHQHCQGMWRPGGEELCICHLSRLSRWRRPGAAGNLCLELGNRAELVLSMEQAGEGWPGWWVQGQVASLRPGGRQGLTWGAASTGTGGDAPGLTGRWSLAAQCVPQVRCRPALAPVHQEEGHPFEMGLLVC